MLSDIALTLAIAVTAAAAAASTIAGTPPNILIILTDDQVTGHPSHHLRSITRSAFQFPLPPPTSALLLPYPRCACSPDYQFVAAAAAVVHAWHPHPPIPHYDSNILPDTFWVLGLGRPGVQLRERHRVLPADSEPESACYRAGVGHVPPLLFRVPGVLGMFKVGITAFLPPPQAQAN